MKTSKPNSVAGESLLHPLCVAAVALLILNDHWLKHVTPGVFTGKASDVAGLVFMPHLLVAIAQWGCRLTGRTLVPTRASFLAVLGAVAAVFSAIKTLPVGDRLYEHALQSLFNFVGIAVKANNTRDPSDLLALPALVLAYWVGPRTWWRQSYPASDAPLSGAPLSARRPASGAHNGWESVTTSK